MSKYTDFDENEGRDEVVTVTWRISRWLKDRLDAEAWGFGKSTNTVAVETLTKHVAEMSPEMAEEVRNILRARYRAKARDEEENQNRKGRAA